MKFRELSKESVDKVEEGILKKWKEMDILNKTIEKRKDSENFVFYDGPIYANAKPGIHHVFAKSIKDAFCKYKTMMDYVMYVLSHPTIGYLLLSSHPKYPL